MHDVVRRGTATRALQLKRGDLAGKTGTTNDFIDAWFCGYQPTLVGIAWIGFDQPKKLGNGETGGSAALPIWMGYMEKALKDVPESYMEAPAGLIAVNVPADPSGKNPSGKTTELIYKESLPPAPPENENPATPGTAIPDPAGPVAGTSG
jgi:penicillin-binding protein 1A